MNMDLIEIIAVIIFAPIFIMTIISKAVLPAAERLAGLVNFWKGIVS